MKLDRNIIAGPRNGKYALLKLRRMRELETAHPETNGQINDALAVLAHHGILDVIRLKDQCAARALRGYADVARRFDPEYAHEVDEMAGRSGPNHPNCRWPD